MKIKEIANMGEDDDGTHILSVNEAEVTGIGKINNDKQLILLSDNEGNAIKVALLRKELFLLQGTEGITVSLKSGPPVRNKPTGIVFRWTQRGGRVEVSDKAILIIHGEDNTKAEEVKEKELSPSKLTGNSKALQPESVEMSIGFNDEYFLGKLKERAHLFRMVSIFSHANELEWSNDTMSAITTGLIMDAIHNQKTILKVQQVNKERFQPIEKPHNPEPVKEHPPADPVQSNIVEFLNRHEKSGWAQVEVGNNTPIIVALRDAARRGGMMHFYFSCKAKRTELKGKNKERFEAIELFIDELPKSLESAMALEAMIFDVAKANDLDYITDSEKAEAIAEKCAEKYRETSKGNIRGIVMQYLNDQTS